MSQISPALPLIVDSVKRDLTSVIAWGREKMAEGAYEVAVQHFTAALELKPGLMQALVARGDCLLKLGYEDKAREDFAEVIKRDAGFNRNIYVMIALCFKRSGEYKQAIRYLTHCIGHFSTFRPALIARGELSLKVQDYKRACNDFRQVLAQSQADVVARRGLAEALRGLGEFKESLRQYQIAIEDATMRRDTLERQELSKEGYGSDTTRGGGGGSQYDSEAEDDHFGQWPDDDGYRPSTEQQQSDADNGYNTIGSGRGQSENENADELRDAASGDDELQYQEEQQQQQQQQQGLQLQQYQHSSQNDGGDQRVLEESFPDMEKITEFLTDTLLRRALLLRLVGDLTSAGECLLEILRLDVRHGLALFWYGKLLLEQHRHQEAPGFLQASIQHCDATRAHAHALLGALFMSWGEPDCEGSVRHLREASRLLPGYMPIKITLWISQGMASLRLPPKQPDVALNYLDKALNALTSTKGSKGLRPPAGSGGSAAAALNAGERCPEEQRWLATKALNRRRDDLAKTSDLDMALDCNCYLHLVSQDSPQAACEVPFLLRLLRTVALCDLNRWEEAVADCKKALAIRPSDELAQYTLNIANGILRAQNGEHEQAVISFTKALRARPVSTESRIYRARALAKASRKEGAEAATLLERAVADLTAVTQQAQISGEPVPIGVSFLHAACLCALQRGEDAKDVLEESRHTLQSSRPSSSHSATALASAELWARQNSLEAETAVILGQYQQAVEACTRVLEDSHGSGKRPSTSSSLLSQLMAEARLLRGCCYSSIGQVAQAFEDFREVVLMAPERPMVHQAGGELLLRHGHFAEAATSFGTAARLSPASSPNLIYKKAVALFAQGNLNACMAEIGKVLRVNPNMGVALRARDGVAALQSALEGSWAPARLRFNVLLHAPPPVMEDNLLGLFLPHELAVYRGICSLYIGDVAAAIQDFATGVELAEQCLLATQQSQQLASDASGNSFGSPEESNRAPTHMRSPTAISSQKGLDHFACEAQYNIALGQLLDQQYDNALSTCQHLLECEVAMKELGPHTGCLAWFLIGICHLARGDSDGLAQEAFTQSYAHDSCYVDDFLQRHGRHHEPAVDMGVHHMGHGVSPVHPPSTGCPIPTPPRRVGAPPYRRRALGDQSKTSPIPVPAIAPGCDASGRAICCLRPGKHRLSSRLPPLKIQVRDVLIWGCPSVDWPSITTIGPTVSSSLSRLDLLQPQDTVHQIPKGNPT